MKKTGEIIIITSGAFGTIAVIVAFIIEKMTEKLGKEVSDTILNLREEELIFSIAVIIIGIILIEKESIKATIILFLITISGVFLLDDLIAVFMVLALIGGIISVVEKRKRNKYIIKK